MGEQGRPRRTLGHSYLENLGVSVHLFPIDLGQWGGKEGESKKKAELPLARGLPIFIHLVTHTHISVS